jgi:hypothetical protein
VFVFDIFDRFYIFLLGNFFNFFKSGMVKNQNGRLTEVELDFRVVNGSVRFGFGLS